MSLLGAPTTSLARPPLPQTDGNSFTLAQLNILEPIALSGPLGTEFVNFRLPADWALTGGAQLQLNFDTTVSGFEELQVASAVSRTITNTTRATNASNALDASARYGGNLRVVMNNVPLAIVPLNRNGVRLLSIPIPARAFSATQENGLNYLAFQLDDKVQCGKGDQTRIVIDPQTKLVVPNRASPIKKDLTQLPRPFFQRSFVPDEATIVVPDEPTALEMQAALNVAAGFGRMTGGGLAITLTTVSQLTPTLRDSTHLILVGKPAGLPLLKDLKLPLALKGNGFTNAQPNNGVLQLADSPWNASKAILVVSGDTDAGVVASAQALSTGNVRASKFTNFALILADQKTAAQPKNLLADTDVTLHDLGYTNNLLQGGGSQTARYAFSLPEEQIASSDSYVEVSYVHSAVFDYARSNVSVVLNGVNIGGIRLDDNSTRLSRARISLPPDVLRAGQNQIGFRSEATHRDACVLDGNGLWLNIQSDTRLHIPTRANNSDSTTRKVNLSGYLNALTSQADLSNIAFVVGAKDAGGWNAAAKLASGLGAQFDPAIAKYPLDVVAAYSDVLPDALRAQREVIVVGKASTLVGVIDTLNNVLPAPFPKNGNVALERDATLQYRAPTDADIGYLQLLLAPWNAKHNVLAVMGSTDAGLLSASYALLDPKTRSKVSGNLVFINGEQMVATDNQKTLARVVAAGAAASASPAQPSTQSSTQPANSAPPTWIVPIIVVAVGALLLIGAIASFVVISRRRKN